MSGTVIAIFLLVLTTSTWGLSTHDILKSIRECKAENNCQENLLQKLRQHEIPQTDEGLNAMYCTGQKIGMITTDKMNGEILTTVLTKLQMDDAKAASVAAICQTQLIGSSHAEAAKSLMTCIKNNSN